MIPVQIAKVSSQLVCALKHDIRTLCYPELGNLEEIMRVRIGITSGSGGRIRTYDQVINSHPLYH